MNKRIALVMVIVSFICSAVIYAAVEKETQEAADENGAQPIPKAPPVENAQTAVAQQKRDKKAQLQQERGERARVAQGEEEEKKEAADQGEAVDLNTRTLLIFNDTSEIGSPDQNSGFTGQAIAALSQKAGPILITGSLLTHIFNIQGNHHQDTKDLLNVFYALFDAREWQVYKLNTMYLLIPRIGRTQLEDFNLSSARRIDMISKDALVKESDGEYQKYKDAYLADKNKGRIAGQDVLADIVTLLTGMADKVERNWVIYLGGHGGYKQSIAAFDIPIFKQLIDFLDTKIKTKLFVYDSCYAAGYNAAQVYGDLKYSIDSGAESQGRVDSVRAGFRPIQDIRTYPFTIVTGATTDAPTYARFSKLNLAGDMDSAIKYDEFVKETQKESINYPVALGYLFPLINRPARWHKEIASIPQIRPAHVPAWLPVVDVNKAVIRIGKVMAYSKAITKDALIVKQYEDIQSKIQDFNQDVYHDNMQDPKALLLAVQNINFPIVIHEDITKMPAFVSLLPGNATHTLASVTYYEEPFSLKDFTADIEYGEPKKIIIKNLKILNDQGNQEEFVDVVIDLKTRLSPARASMINVLTRQKKYLFASAPDQEAFNTQHETFLRLASSIEKINAEFVELSRTVDLNYKNAAGDNVLHYAVTAEKSAVVSYLLFRLGMVGRDKEKIDINAQNNEGMTPLMMAAEHVLPNNTIIISYLLEAGADKNIKNKNGKTAYDLLKERNISTLMLHGLLDQIKPDELVSVGAAAVDEQPVKQEHLLSRLIKFFYNG